MFLEVTCSHRACISSDLFGSEEEHSLHSPPGAICKQQILPWLLFPKNPKLLEGLGQGGRERGLALEGPELPSLGVGPLSRGQRQVAAFRGARLGVPVVIPGHRRGHRGLRAAGREGQHDRRRATSPSPLSPAGVGLGRPPRVLGPEHPMVLAGRDRVEAVSPIYRKASARFVLCEAPQNGSSWGSAWVPGWK